MSDCKLNKVFSQNRKMKSLKLVKTSKFLKNNYIRKTKKDRKFAN